MSLKGRPEGEHRSAQREGTPTSPKGRPEGEHGSAQPRAVAIYTDGACKGNPGPGGWGALLVAGGHERELWGGEPHTTNNRMELTAVIRALEALTRRCEVDLYTDSQYVKNGIESWIHGWKRNGWKTSDRKPVKNAELWRELDQLAQRHAIRWHWVKGHADHPENTRADALANRGVAGTGGRSGATAARTAGGRPT